MASSFPTLRSISEKSSKGKPTKSRQKIYGEGGYGTVIGDPRNVCTGEMPDSVHDMEVSKHFSDNDEAIREYEDIMSFVDSLTDEDKRIIEETTLLPKKRCIEDLDALFKGDTPKGNDKIREKLLKKRKVMTSPNHMIVYPKASHDLMTEFDHHIDNIDTGIKLLENILKAIVIFVKNKYTHRDIKKENCVIQVKSSKIIDMADIQKFGYGTKEGKMEIKDPYSAWPSTILALALDTITVENVNSITESRKYKSRLYHISRRFRNLFNCIPASIPRTKNHKCKAIIIKLYLQKMFMGFTVEDVESFPSSQFEAFGVDPYTVFEWCRTNYGERMGMYLALLNDMTNEEKIQKINSSVDIYSFGTLLMDLLISAFMKDIIRTKEDVDKWMKIFGVMYQCMMMDDIHKPDKANRMYDLCVEWFDFSPITSTSAAAGATGGAGGGAASASASSGGSFRSRKTMKKKRRRKGKLIGKINRKRKVSLKRIRSKTRNKKRISRRKKTRRLIRNL